MRDEAGVVAVHPAGEVGAALATRPGGDPAPSGDLGFSSDALGKGLGGGMAYNIPGCPSGGGGGGAHGERSSSPLAQAPQERPSHRRQAAGVGIGWSDRHGQRGGS